MTGSFHEDLCIFTVICLWVLIRMRNVWGKAVAKIKTRILFSVMLLWKSCRLWDNVAKTQNELLCFHRISVYANALQCYVVRTLLVLISLNLAYVGGLLRACHPFSIGLLRACHPFTIRLLQACHPFTIRLLQACHPFTIRLLQACHPFTIRLLQACHPFTIRVLRACHPFTIGLGGPQSQTGPFGKEANLLPVSGMEQRS
jgi:hypothetical protein